MSFRNISDSVDKAYDNFIVDTVNDHCLRLSVMNCEYRWHYHDNTDEIFIVREGELKIEIKNSPTVILLPGECIRIPAKTIHKTSAAGRTVNLTIERNAEDTVFVD